LSVADVANSGSGSRVFDYDLSIGVRDDDRAVVGDDEDLVEGVVHIDHVGD